MLRIHKINELQVMKMSTITCYYYLIVISLFFCLFISVSCQRKEANVINDPNLEQALTRYSHMLDDSIMYYMNLVDTTYLNEYDRKYYDILGCIIAREKNNRRSQSITKIDSLLAFCIRNNDYYYAGEMAHTGSDYYHYKDKTKMTQYLKQAEHYYFLSEMNPRIGIMPQLYLRISFSLSRDKMHDDAIEYAYKALPYIIKDDKYNNMEFNRMLLFNMPDTTSIDTATRIFNKAVFYAKQLRDSCMLYDIEIFYEGRFAKNEDRQMEVAKKSCTTTRINHHAEYVIEYYLNRHQIDSAKKYLSILALDTAKSIGIKDNYLEYEARIWHEKRNYAVAYDKLYSLYQSVKQRNDTTPLAGTYLTVKHYDEMYEQERELQEKAKIKIHKIILITLLVILSLAFVIALLFLLYYKEQKRLQQVKNEHQRTRHELALQQEQAKTDRMAAELKAMQDVLKEKLRQRLDITKRLQIDAFKGHTTETLPQWVQELLNDYTFTDESKWEAFRQEYNHATNNELDRLQKEYPSLTEADIQYIALSKLELNVEEMCILLGCTNRTIWNRKQIVRTKLGLPVSPGRANKA